jgi:monothiol glutaredoxin
MTGSDSTREKITSLIQADEVVLFMKGSRSFPQCGFSATVVQILNSLVPSYATVNVLADPDIRQGIKDYSDWPTIPQLYVRGEFVGGCDIVRDMHASGELQKLLGGTVPTPEAPSITITERAAAALREALGEGEPGDVVHLNVDERFQHALGLGPRGDGEIEVEAGGVTVMLDRISATRAGGLRIDFVEGPDGQGFRIDNPNAPADVEQIGPKELAAKLEAGEIQHFYDVRTPAERERARIEGTVLLDDAAMTALEALDPATPIAFHCHHGGRSQAAAEHFRNKGFRKLYNLAGGIDAWSQQVDPSIPRY